MQKVIFIIPFVLLIFLTSGCDPENGTVAINNDDSLEKPADEFEDQPVTKNEDESAEDAAQGLSEEPQLIIIYLQDDRLMLSDGINPARPLTDGRRITDPILAPCGKKAIFRYHYELRAVNLEGEPQPFSLITDEHIRYKKNKSLNDEEPQESCYKYTIETISWINERSKIAFNTACIWESYTFYHDDLWVADLESGLVEEFLTEGYGGERFAYSPDGSKILVATSQSVSMVNLDGSGWQEILTFPFIPAYDYTQTPQPVWAEDSSYGLILIPDPEPLPQYAEMHHDYWELPRNGDVWKIYPDGEAEKLFSTKWVCVYTMTTDLLFSPDRRYVLHHEGMHLKESELNFLNSEGKAVASFSGIRQIHGWDEDNKLIVQKEDADGLFFIGGDQSVEALEMPPNFEVQTCRAIGPNVYLVSGRQTSSNQLSLWLLGVQVKPQLIEARIDSFHFDGLYLEEDF